MCALIRLLLAFFGVLASSGNASEVGRSDIILCSPQDGLQFCINQAPIGSIVALQPELYETGPIFLRSGITLWIVEGATVLLAADAELNKKAFGGVANSVISAQGEEGAPVFAVELVVDGVLDGNRQHHPYEGGGVECVNFAWVEESLIRGNGVIQNCNGDGIDLDAVSNVFISGVTVQNNGGSGVHFGSPRPVRGSKNSLIYNVKSFGNGFQRKRNGFDVSWPNPDAVTFVSCTAIDNYRNYEIDASGSVVVSSTSIDNGGVTERDVFDGAEVAVVNGEDHASFVFLTKKTRVLLKRDLKKLLGMGTPHWLDEVEY